MRKSYLNNFIIILTAFLIFMMFYSPRPAAFAWLALAGGFGQIANAKEVKVFRQGEKGERQVATFDVEKIRAGADPDP